MLKHLAVVFLLAFAPLGACSSLGIGSPGTTLPSPTVVTEAQKTLHVVEQGYAAGLKTLLALQARGLIKGVKAAAVEKAVTAAGAALRLARQAVDAGTIDVALILAAAAKVSELIPLFQ